MDRVDNPELQRMMIDHLADLYNIRDAREPNHLSSYTTCLTKSFFSSSKKAIEPTEQEVLLFVLGYGLQDVLTPPDMSAPVYEQDGIIYRPDMSFSPASVEQLYELKTTRKSSKNHYNDDALPITWLTYMMGGCKMRGVRQYHLVVLYMMGNYAPPFPQIMADTITFTDEEIESNWQMILANKQVLDNAIATNTIPTPFSYCYSWECVYCRYKLVCETIVRLGGEPDGQQ